MKSRRNHCPSCLGRLAGTILIVCTALMLTPATLEAAEGDAPPKIDDAALATMLQNFDKVEKIEYPWGWIRWLMSSKLDPKAEMTFGLVQLNAAQRNPMHVHANCEEHLYVLSGSCEHVLGDKTLVLGKGDVLRIPRGVPHKARTFPKEPMLAVIVYSSGDRQFEVVEER